jgi:hypothetical protein
MNSDLMQDNVLKKELSMPSMINRRQAVWMAASSLMGAAICQSAKADSDTIKESRFWVADGLPLTLDRWMPNATVPMVGKILEINDREVLYVPKGSDAERKLMGDQVIAIDVAWGSDSAAEAHRLFRARKWIDAIKAAEQGVQSGILQWQQRILFSEIIDSYRNLGRFAESGVFFLTLAKHSPPTFLYACMPLIWTRTQVEKKALDSAREWIDQDSLEGKLLAASWLLSGAERGKAESTLRSLAQNKKAVIAQLATAQLWRAIPATDGVSDKLQSWQMIRNRMLLPVQVGPTELIADKLDQSGNTSQAIPEWLRIAVVHRDRYDAASRAIARAAKAKRDAGKEAEAKRIEQMADSLP